MGFSRGEHDIRRIEDVGGAEDGDLMLFHRLEHGRLRLGRRAIDLVAEHHVREDRAGLELELAMTVGLGQHLRADDIRGHQVGRELNSFEAEPERFAGRLDHQRLAESGHAFDQNMAAAKQRGQHLSHDLAMADDHARDFALGARENLAKFRDPLVG